MYIVHVHVLYMYVYKHTCTHMCMLELSVHVQNYVAMAVNIDRDVRVLYIQIYTWWLHVVHVCVFCVCLHVCIV